MSNNFETIPYMEAHASLHLPQSEIEFHSTTELNLGKIKK